jgi:hypothetical protein
MYLGVSGSILGKVILAVLNKIFRSFPHYVQENDVILPKMRHDIFLSIFRVKSAIKQSIGK